MINQTIYQVLMKIPQSNEPSRTIRSLCTECSAEEMDVLFGIVKILSIWGIIILNEKPVKSNSLIQAKSQSAKYALTSIADYIQHNEPIIDDWHTRGLLNDKTYTGVQFLQMLESGRLNRFTNPKPTRSTKIAQVLIKRINHVTGDHEFLFQFDHSANQYQLIGGRWSEKDGKQIKTTMIREIKEELHLNNLNYPESYNLITLIENLIFQSISPTFGALTHYGFWIFQMTGLKQNLKLQDIDKWVPLEMMLQGHVIVDKQSYPFKNPDMFQKIDEQLPAGLQGLSPSFEQ